ncbi:acetylornithine aminotransferase [Heliomicrobium modesticaldum Ice1]|uniref:Acetylornithine aminotransferase n=1 Tax=Heliobacterium modesticaldum (strain ATCC 51547 / Ice1) TaxID=498761 RepID=B0TCA9_HELMI|nr:acetylornithine transaminase [Heliomicrobium modesticaldum]ABZ84008.1 acetylornithine aminotransferase [Heliomicrobium modesticaldum Ice1]
MNNAQIVELGKKYVMNTYGRLPISLVKGQGARLWDADGREYLDFLAGLAVNSLGHCHPKVVDALQQQAATLLHVSNLYWIEPQVQLAQVLVENSFADKVFFCNSGAEANEGAIKLARKYAKKTWGSDKYEIITMEKSFHGRTLATVTATAQPKYQKDYEPLPQGFRYVPFGDLKALERAISPHTCAILVEPVQGEGGVNLAEPSFWQGLAKLAAANKLLLIFDEVQCGLGRTGKLFAHEHYGVTPHIMTLAKALAGGAPMGALLATDDVANAFQPGDHASTFGGNPLVAAAAVAVMDVLLNDGLMDNCREMAAYFMGHLRRLQEKYPFITEVRGLGLMVACELDRPGADIVANCLEKGLIINCTAGNVLRFLPPLIINKADVDEAVAVLEEVLASVVAADAANAASVADAASKANTFSAATAKLVPTGGQSQ